MQLGCFHPCLGRGTEGQARGCKGLCVRVHAWACMCMHVLGELPQDSWALQGRGKLVLFILAGAFAHLSVRTVMEASPGSGRGLSSLCAI